MRAILVAAALCAAAANAQTSYDLLIKGGHVVDAKNGISAIRDVAIAGGKIAAVAENIPASNARRVVDATGLYVTPGLVDMHIHAFASSMGGEYTGEHSIRPDGFTFRAGVTTAVDAGSSGWRNFEEFETQVVKKSKTRILAFLNIVGYGMGGRMTVEQDVPDMQPVPTAATIKAHRDVLVGVKIAHFDGPEWVAVERAVEAGKIANVPVMVDFATFRPERPFQDLVTKKLRPGDIYTHLYLGAVPMFDAEGKLLPYLSEARQRGVIFDVGHGGGSFLFRQAVPAIKQGFLPDSISTDLHIDSMNAGMKDFTNVMSKFLNIGMEVDDIIARSTWAPAREIHREEFGHLTPGAPGDVAVLRVATGDFGFIDSSGGKLKGNRKFVCELTVREGRVVWDLNGIATRDWQSMPARRPRQ